MPEKLFSGVCYQTAYYIMRTAASNLFSTKIRETTVGPIRPEL